MPIRCRRRGVVLCVANRGTAPVVLIDGVWQPGARYAREFDDPATGQASGGHSPPATQRLVSRGRGAAARSGTVPGALAASMRAALLSPGPRRSNRSDEFALLESLDAGHSLARSARATAAGLAFLADYAGWAPDPGEVAARSSEQAAWITLMRGRSRGRIAALERAFLWCCRSWPRRSRPFARR